MKDINEDRDTTTQIVQVNRIMPHKRGVYKTYEEYLNSPSVNAEFTITPSLKRMLNIKEPGQKRFGVFQTANMFTSR